MSNQEKKRRGRPPKSLSLQKNKPNSNQNKSKKTRGRPTKYTEELAKKICDLIACSSESLQSLCKSHDWMPAKCTIFDWIYKHKKFSDQYIEAKIAQTECLVDDAMYIADQSDGDFKLNDKGEMVINHENIQRSKLRVHVRHHAAAHLSPKRYGDPRRLQALEDQNDELKRELNEMKAKYEKEYEKEY